MQPRHAAGSTAALILAAWLSQADVAAAHVIVGNRFFPATLGIDDPGTNDELALPTFTYIPVNGDGSLEYDVAFEYAKRITPDFALSVDGAYTRLKPGGFGFQNFGLAAKYQIIVNPEHEFIVSIGLASEIGGTGAARVGADPFSTVTPTVYFGKGLGDLPNDMGLVRPFAITGQFGYAVPTQSRTRTISIDPDSGDRSIDVERNPTSLDYGFSLQYSLPYLNANVREVGGPEFVKHLIPLVEVQLSTPVSNTMAGSRVTTGTLQPGIIYSAKTYQIGVEALIPINDASGKHVGVVGQLHFYLDDIFPNSIGKPIFQ